MTPSSPPQVSGEVTGPGSPAAEPAEAAKELIQHLFAKACCRLHPSPLPLLGTAADLHAPLRSAPLPLVTACSRARQQAAGAVCSALDDVCHRPLFQERRAGTLLPGRKGGWATGVARRG
jgi:hypothetical protein